MRSQLLLKPVLVALLLAALTACTPAATGTGGPVDFDAAADLVLARIVRPDSLRRPLIVFGWPESLQPGDQLQPYEREGFESPAAVTVIERESWFFWIDDAPGAQFVHPNRFVFVDAASGEISASEQEWWPVLNGEGLWIDEGEYWNPANWVFSNVDYQPRPPSGGGRHPAGGQLAAPRRQAGSPGAAIVINGWEPGETLEDTFAEDADQMHDALTDAGFNTTYLGPSQDTNADRDGEPTTAARFNWFGDKARQLQPSQTLFVYITGHGGVTDDGFGSVGPVFEHLLKDELARFDPGVHIIVVLQGCKSGSFIDTLRGVADVTVSATDATTSSYADIDTDDDPNPEDRGSEFTSGFVEDWNQLRADPAARQRIEARAARAGTNFWEELAAEAFLTAVEKDAAFARGWEFPLVGRGGPETRPTPTATPTITPTPSATPTPTGTPTALEVFGRWLVEVLVENDAANHDEFIDMPEEIVLEVTGPEFTVSGPFPWVTVTGELAADGSFTASGAGEVAGFQNVTVKMEGLFDAGTLSAIYTMGAGGELPTGQAIEYSIEGEPAP